jgi:hypothetical protein
MSRRSRMCVSNTSPRILAVTITVRTIDNKKRKETKGEPEYTRDQTRFEQREGIWLQAGLVSILQFRLFRISLPSLAEPSLAVSKVRSNEDRIHKYNWIKGGTPPEQ